MIEIRSIHPPTARIVHPSIAPATPTLSHKLLPPEREAQRIIRLAHIGKTKKSQEFIFPITSKRRIERSTTLEGAFPESFVQYMKLHDTVQTLLLLSFEISSGCGGRVHFYLRKGMQKAASSTLQPKTIL